MKHTLIFFLSILSANIYAQSVTLNTPTPEAGQQITVTYTGKLVKEGTKISCVLQHTPSNYSPTKGIPTKIINNQLVGSFTLPDSVTFFHIVISNKKEYDNNDGKGYGFNIYKNGKPIKWTFLSEGHSIFWNKVNFNGNIDKERALELIEKEFKLHPDLEKTASHYYIRALSRTTNRKNEAVDLAKLRYDQILKTGEGERFTYYYAEVLANDSFKKQDSLLSLVANKYPKGFTAFDRKLMLLNGYSTYDPDTAIIIYNNIKRDFPNATLKGQRTASEGLLATYAYKKDVDKFNETLNLLLERDKSQQTIIICATSSNDMAANLIEAKDIKQAKIFAEKSIFFHKQYDSLSIYYGMALETYAKVLSKSGDKKGAIVYQDKAVYLRNNIFPNVNQQLIQYLIEDNQFEKAKTKAEEFIVDNVSNPKIDSLYKVAYIAINKNESGFDKTYSEVKEKSQLGYIEYLKQKMLNIDAPNFELKDLKGNKVKLSDFRGSVVVLDFWATWCGPCIKSFPAMQKTMSKLKDKSVKFLFIDTMEEEIANKNERIKKILENKKVSEFHVLIDKMKNLSYEASTAYNVESIPAKYIIDKNGKLRYKSTGFGSDEDLIKELTAVIGIINE